MDWKCVRRGVFVCVALLASVASGAAGKLVSDGQTVVFLGDSITNYGATNPDGYVKLVVQGLAANGIKVKWFGAGVPGHKAWHMKDRFVNVDRFSRSGLCRQIRLAIEASGKDLGLYVDGCGTPQLDGLWEKKLAPLKPSCLVISTYSYEIFHLKAEDAAARVKRLAEKAAAAGTQVIVATTRVTNNLAAEKTFNDAIRALDNGKDIVVLDQREIIAKELARRANPQAVATFGGYPLNPSVSLSLGRALLPMLGFTDGEISKTYDGIEKSPDFAPLTAGARLTFSEYDRLRTLANESGMSLEELTAIGLRRGAGEVAVIGYRAGNL